MPLTLATLIDNPQTHRIIIYGAPGSGKTYSIGGLAETHTLHYLSLENGHKTLLNPECVKLEARKNVNIYKMLDSPETPIAAASLDYLFLKGNANLCDYHGRHDCSLCKKDNPSGFSVIDFSKFTAKDILVIDSLTQWVESISHRLTPNANSDAKKEFEYYRLLGLHLSRSLGRIQLLDHFSIIIISHEGEVTSAGVVDSEDAPQKIGPAGGTRSFARNNSRYFDGAYYCTVMNKSHRMQSSSMASTTVLSKDRSNFDTSKYKDPREALKALFNPELRIK
jgi:AAA domain